MQKIIFYYWKNKKIPKVPSSAYCEITHSHFFRRRHRRRGGSLWGGTRRTKLLTQECHPGRQQNLPLPDRLPQDRQLSPVQEKVQSVPDSPKGQIGENTAQNWQVTRLTVQFEYEIIKIIWIVVSALIKYAAALLTMRKFSCWANQSIKLIRLKLQSWRQQSATLTRRLSAAHFALPRKTVKAGAAVSQPRGSWLI